MFDHRNESLFRTVHQLKPDDPNAVVFSHAARGEINQVNKLLAESETTSISLYWAIQGYALGGHVDEVDKLLEQEKNQYWRYWNAALWGYACGGHETEVNKLIAKDASHNLAVRGYLLGGHLTQENILRLMSFTDDKELRRLLAEELRKTNRSLDINELMKKSKKINILMRQYHLDYDKASRETRKTVDKFLKIYQLVKEKNEPKLNEMVKQGICIGRYYNEHNVISLLAKEGDIDSVNFLLNKFKANLNDAVFGYACGGHVDAVNKLLAEGASIDYAIRGYAYAGQVDMVNKLLAQGTRVCVAIAIQGYALGGHVDEINKLIEVPCPDFYREEAICSYAFRGQVDEVNKLLLKQGGSYDYCMAIEGYAYGGHIDEVNKLINDPSLSKLEKKTYRLSAIRGYALGGYVDEVNTLILQHEFHKEALDAAVYAYARGGHLDLTDNPTDQNADPKILMGGFARSWHIAEVNGLIAMGISYSSAVSGYLLDRQPGKENLLRLMSFTDDKKLRQLLAEEAHKKNNLLDINDLISKSEMIREMSLYYGLDYNEAIHIIRQYKETAYDEAIKKTRCQKIYRLAKEKNRKALVEIVGHGKAWTLDFAPTDHRHCPVRLLAMEGDTDSVELLNYISFCRSDAIFGFACGGHVDEVNKLLAQDESLYDNAIIGYAYGGHVDEVNKILAKWEIAAPYKARTFRSAAISGYALAGHEEEVNKLFVYEENRVHALMGYDFGGHITQENILRLMSLTDDSRLRQDLATAAKGKNLKINIQDLMEKSGEINRIMREHHLYYDHARSFCMRKGFGSSHCGFMTPQVLIIGGQTVNTVSRAESCADTPRIPNLSSVTF